MIDTKVMNLMLIELDSTDEKFKIALDKFIKMGLKLIQGSEEFQEELDLYSDVLFHVFISDIDYNIWLKKTGPNLTYNTSFYEKSSEELRTIHFILTKEIMKKIFKQKLDFAEGWFKGLIKIDGELSDAIIARNLLKSFSKMFNYHLRNKFS
ncbi:MAG: hypothetical protein ACFE85_08085 [Candidatus Hodarchaeota archaeon]